MNVSSVKNLNGEVFSAVQDASLTNVVQTNSGNWQDITAYQSNSASYLTAHQDLSDYYTTADANTLSSMLSGAIDYVSANAGDEFPVSADEAIQYVQTNSGTIDDTVTSYQTNSGTFLTAHQSISAEEWNSNYETVNTNSGAWGGSALPISAGPGIKVNLVDNTLVFSNDETVLWSGDQIGSAFSITGSEPATNFQYIYVLGHTNDLQPNMFNFFSDTHQLTITSSMQLSDYQFTTWGEKLMNIRVTQDCIITTEVTKERQWGTTAYTGMNTFGIYKVVGINRK